MAGGPAGGWVVWVKCSKCNQRMRLTGGMVDGRGQYWESHVCGSCGNEVAVCINPRKDEPGREGAPRKAQ
ncbi:MAG: hypothetical protein P8Y66_08550 [Nitrospirota bacterium]|jgi:hypothetical protein